MSEKESYKIFIMSGIGAGIGIIGTSAIILLMALILSIGNIPPTMIEPMSIAAAVFGAFCGGFVSARLFGENGLVCGIVSGGIYFLVLWAFGGILGIGDYTAFAAIKAATVLFASALGGIIGVNSYKIK